MADFLKCRRAVLLAIAVALSGCAPIETAAARVGDSRWTMVDASFGMPAGATPTLEFRAGRVNAHSGCNRGSGGYSDTGGSLAIPALMSTKMACRDDINRFETNYYRLLSSNPTYVIDGDTMTLTAGSDRARFQRGQ